MNVELTIKGDIQRMHLEPNDVLVLTVPATITEDTVEVIREQMKVFMRKVGLDNRVLVLSDEIHLQIARPT